jgi:hypothetical protein
MMSIYIIVPVVVRPVAALATCYVVAAVYMCHGRLTAHCLTTWHTLIFAALQRVRSRIMRMGKRQHYRVPVDDS